MNPLNNVLGISSAILLAICILFGYISYSLYGKVQAQLVLNEQLVSDIYQLHEDYERQEKQIKERDKILVELSNTKMELKKDFNKIQTDLDKIDISPTKSNTQNAPSISSPLPGDLVGLLNTAYSKATGEGDSSK